MTHVNTPFPEMDEALPTADATDADAGGALPWITADHFAELSGRGIAAGFRDMILDGRVAVGARLPTVRDLAQRLGTTPATIADAWSRLRLIGLVETRRRGGTIVLAATPALPAPGLLDLSQALADPALQHGLEAAIAEGVRSANLAPAEREYVTPQLQQAVAPSWPFKPQAWTTGAGGAEAALCAYSAALTTSAIVAIEEPTSPRILEALSILRATPVPVACDGEGPRPEALEQALAAGARTFIYQPRAHLPLGHSISAERLQALAAVIARHPEVVVVEDDGLGPLAQSDPVSLGDRFPDRIIHIRAYCKTYGNDLKTALVAGARPLVERMNEVRSHGYNVTSRILQNTVASLIESPAARRTLATARQRYAERRIALAKALEAHGIATANADGLLLWVPVRDEHSAIINLARRGITVGPGSDCFLRETVSAPHIRIATSRLPDDPSSLEAIADLIAQAIRQPSPLDHD